MALSIAYDSSSYLGSRFAPVSIAWNAICACSNGLIVLLGAREPSVVVIDRVSSFLSTAVSCVSERLIWLADCLPGVGCALLCVRRSRHCASTAVWSCLGDYVADSRLEAS